jgi:hypothetical protein
MHGDHFSHMPLTSVGSRPGIVGVGVALSVDRFQTKDRWITYPSLARRAAVVIYTLRHLFILLLLQLNYTASLNNLTSIPAGPCSRNTPVLRIG